jgi:hypothetical protein
MNTYGIRLPDGTTITDPEWRNVGDVMRAAHGHGVTRMPGTLIRLSGWCTSPTGARPQCDRCRSDRCDHDCHNRGAD